MTPDQIIFSAKPKSSIRLLVEWADTAFWPRKAEMAFNTSDELLKRFRSSSFDNYLPAHVHYTNTYIFYARVPFIYRLGSDEAIELMMTSNHFLTQYWEMSLTSW